MKINYIKLITFIAFAAILVLQVIWLCTNYRLLEANFKKNIDSQFLFSIEQESALRVDDPRYKPKDKVIRGTNMKYDQYTNNRAIQDWLYGEDFPHISLEKVDSIFRGQAKKEFGIMDHSFILTDSLGHIKQTFPQEKKNFSSRFAYKKTIQLRNIAPEYLTLTITSPYKIIFGKMALLLLASLVLGIIVVYGLILQIRMINKQNKAAKIREDFTQSMIHGMKSPITSILMGISTLRSGKKDGNPEEKERYYNIMSRAGNRILTLVNEALTIAQFEDDKVTLSKQNINLPDLLGILKDRYVDNISKPVNFKIETREVKNIYADLNYISEAFGNIIDNAIKYSKENQDADITVSSSLNGNYTKIVFRDKGIGIPAKDQKKIFRKFARSMAVIESKNKVSGFGLGLNFVYQVVKAHKGTITVNSKLGSYSEFIINLPNTDEEDKTITD